MRLEVHLHAQLELCEGVSRKQVETALRPLFDYLDVDHMGEIESLEENQPGIVYHQRDFGLEICCTMEVGSNFFAALEKAMNNMGRLLEQATTVEVIVYHEDGRDENQLIFVGPTGAAIYDAQRRRMAEEISLLLRRHFDESATNEVLALVNSLFRRERKGEVTSDDIMEDLPSTQMPTSIGRRRLH
ncbi:MAG TPA: DUF6806 family protein [Methylophilaceae bacterium]